MKYLLLSITALLMVGCIIEPRPEEPVIPYPVGHWCAEKDSDFCIDVAEEDIFMVIDDNIWSGDVFVSDWYGDVSFTVRESDLFLLLYGVVEFRFEKKPNS